MNKHIANFFSWLFQPLLMATYLSGLLLWLAPGSIGSFFNSKVRFWIWLVVLLTTFVIPVIGLIVMRLSAGIRSLKLTGREERVLPFFLIAVFYGIAAYLMVTRLNINGAINMIFISTALLVLSSAMITIFWKISVHSVGMAGVFGFLLALNAKMPDSISVWLVIIWVLCMGLTMASRLYLNVHRPSEVYAGSILGFCFCYLAIHIFV